MAEHKDYGLVGAGRSLQLGKQGPKLVGDADTDVFLFTAEDGLTLTRAQGANAVNSSDFVTKSQLDSVQTAEATFTRAISYNSGTQTLGIIPAGAKTVITTLTISSVFDGNASITVGTASDNALLMGSTYNDLTYTESFQTITTQALASDTQISVYVTANSATQGNAVVVVSYY